MDGVQQDRKAVRAVRGEGEGLLVGHLTLKNPVGIQVLLLMDCSRDEFKKDKPPTFDGEVNTGKEAKACFLG